MFPVIPVYLFRGWNFIQPPAASRGVEGISFALANGPNQAVRFVRRLAAGCLMHDCVQ